MYTYVYIHMYIYIYVYVCMYIYIYIYRLTSRSTLTQPSETMERRMLAISLSRRLMSSTYSTPRCARANRPGCVCVCMFGFMFACGVFHLSTSEYTIHVVFCVCVYARCARANRPGCVCVCMYVCVCVCFVCMW